MGQPAVDARMAHALLTAMAPLFASATLPVRAGTRDAVEAMLAHVDAAAILPSLASLVQYGSNVRVRAAAADNLTALLLTAGGFGGGRAPDAAAAAGKHVVPALADLLLRGDVKGELKPALERLLPALGSWGLLDGLRAAVCESAEALQRLEAVLAAPAAPKGGRAAK
jgi:hypothetical protein